MEAVAKHTVVRADYLGILRGMILFYLKDRPLFSFVPHFQTALGMPDLIERAIAPVLVKIFHRSIVLQNLNFLLSIFLARGTKSVLG